MIKHHLRWRVINYTHFTTHASARRGKSAASRRMLEDPLNANKVFEALYEHRWAFSAEEQDAHELFHVLTSTLDEESAAFPGS